MSEEQRNEETEVEAHGVRGSLNEEPRDEAGADDEVEAHGLRASGTRASGTRAS